MKLLQICNVGNICGGTAACAWTIQRALPGWSHQVWFRSRPTSETAAAFSGATICHVPQINTRVIHESGADVALLHNIGPFPDEINGSPEFPSLVIQYHHSQGVRQTADLHVACSQWLGNQLSLRPAVLYQPVPVPLDGSFSPRDRFTDELIIGRLCTPTARKWPAELVLFYRNLARRHRNVQWEFVGAPQPMQPQLADACEGRVRFHEPDWQARQHLRRWHVLLYSQPHFTETFGRTVAEAMRAGCVPIVDSQGGFVEQIETGETGFLCSTREEFHLAVSELSNPATRWRHSLAAKARADSLFSLRAFAERFYAQISSFATP